jgi:hypothetical protein
MSKEKQPPVELVEKFEQVIDVYDDSEHMFRYLHLKTKCAQIAVQHAEEENRELRELNNKLLSLIEKMTERIKNDIGGNYNSVSDYLSNLGVEGELLIDKAKQLLNK